MMRRSRMLRACLTLRIAQRAHDVLFESRTLAIIGNNAARRQAPWVIGELLAGCGLNERIPGHCRQRAAAEERPPIEQTVSSNRYQIFRLFRHDIVLLAVSLYTHALVLAMFAAALVQDKMRAFGGWMLVIRSAQMHAFK